MNGLAADRIRFAIARADEAFWDAISEAFPEATTGDLAPDDLLLWESARNRVVMTWLSANTPPGEV